MDKLNTLQEETLSVFYQVINETSLEQFINIKFRDNPKLSGGNITKISVPKGIWIPETTGDVYIEVNEGIFDVLNIEDKLIVVRNCITSINWDMNKDKLTITKPEILGHIGVINEYGAEKVVDVVKRILEIQSQKKDKDAEAKADSKGKDIKEV